MKITVPKSQTPNFIVFRIEKKLRYRCFPINLRDFVEHFFDITLSNIFLKMSIDALEKCFCLRL